MITQTIYSITLIYIDGTRWYAGDFDLASKDAWIAEEMTRSYWKNDTQIEVIEKTIQVGE